MKRLPWEVGRSPDAALRTAATSAALVAADVLEALDELALCRGDACGNLARYWRHPELVKIERLPTYCGLCDLKYNGGEGARRCDAKVAR